MSRIQLLPDEVASQVAAGEVVERPASVVKELVENAIDAGAKRIEVLVRRGGIALIRVVDDGSGMDRDDALLCIERHATSKIRAAGDLAAISTLGFRGEAIPSIASVSRFKLTTREHGAVAGTELSITGGKLDHLRESGEAPGTQVEVRSLFYNVPARRKFLRTENTEMSWVEQQMTLQAIGHPEIGFTLMTDHRTLFQLPPTGSLGERIRDLCGGTLAAQLLEVPQTVVEEVVVSGYIGQPGVSRSSRSQQYVFVNGRAVENSTISHALREGYHTALMKGQYPVTFLFVEVDPAAVDVNVHPAKREVRFRDPAAVREAVARAISQTLEANRSRWSAQFTAPPPEPLSPPLPPAAPVEPAPLAPLLPGPPVVREPIPEERKAGGYLSIPGLAPAQVEPGPSVHGPSGFGQLPPVQAASPPFAIPGGSPEEEGSMRFRILGVLGSLYILMENNGGLVLVDQHAAHERILFEELRRRMESTEVPSQRLLLSATLQLGPRDSDWVEQNLETLQKMGIGLEPFGANTWKLDSLPPFVRSKEPVQLLREIIDELRATTRQTSRLRLGEELIAKTVCRAAVKANDILREPELVRLVEDLLKCELPYCCPHGRPTMIQISYNELEKKFGRRA